MWRPLDVMLVVIGAVSGFTGITWLAIWATSADETVGGNFTPVGWILLLIFALACGIALLYREGLRVKEIRARERRQQAPPQSE
jgi:amino acid transporter